MGTYGAIYADPPWSFSTYSDKGKGRSAEAWYDCLTLDEIKALPIHDFAADNCVLFLWITDPLLPKGIEVIKSWGFTYKTVGFYWVKLNRSIEIADPMENFNWFMGTGYWTRANPEQCLLATRGKPKPKAHDVRRLIISPRREHSRKPDEIYARIKRLVDGPYLELFARYPRTGWDTAFSTLEGSVERRWRSNEGKPSNVELPTDPIDLFQFL